MLFYFYALNTETINTLTASLIRVIPIHFILHLLNRRQKHTLCL